MIYVGTHGRTHVFTRGGRHYTSFRTTRRNWQQRAHTGRWIRVQQQDERWQERITEKEVARVRLLALELSEDEVTVLAAALTTLLQNLDDQGIETKAGASREKVEAILDDLHTFRKPPAHQSIQS